METPAVTAICDTSQVNERARPLKSIWQIPAATDRLKALHDDKLSCAQIATALSKEFPALPVSRNGVIGKIHRLGLPPHSKPGYNETHRQKRAQAEYGMRQRRQIVHHVPLSPPDVDAIPLHVDLLDLQQGQCRFPYGDGPFTFCGCPAMGDSPYCEPHRLMCSSNMDIYRARCASQQARRIRERAVA